MSPTPRDAQRSSDNNPQRILEQAVTTIIGQMPPKLVPPRNSDEYLALKKDVTKQVLSRHLAVQLSNCDEGIMVTGGTSLMLRAPNQPPFVGVLCHVFGGLVAKGCPRRDAHDSGRRRRFRSHLVLSPPPRMRGWARPPTTAALFAPLASPTSMWPSGSPRIRARRG